MKNTCLTEEELERKKYTCCFTGHRPEKLNCSENFVTQKLELAIQEAIRAGYTDFITGMSKGVDIWAAETILKLRLNNQNLKLICAVPYKGFGEKWGYNWTYRLKDIIEKADYVKYICNCYCYSSYQIRNRWMVDRSGLLIAAYNGAKGGTRNTIEYAKKSDACTIKYLVIL